METQKNLEYPKQSWERRMELEESICLTSDYTTKLQSLRQYGTGTKTNTDQWNKTERPEINPHTAYTLSLTREVKIYNGEKVSSKSGAEKKKSGAGCLK